MCPSAPSIHYSNTLKNKKKLSIFQLSFVSTNLGSSRRVTDEVIRDQSGLVWGAHAKVPDFLYIVIVKEVKQKINEITAKVHHGNENLKFVKEEATDLNFADLT